MEVKELMNPSVVTIEPTASAALAARLISRHNVGALPVVEDGRLVGIVSLADLARSQRFDMEAAQALGEISENIIRRRF